MKKIMAIALAATIPLQGLGYAAYAQSASQVDAEFMGKLEAALEQRPELVLMAAQRAQQRAQQQEQARMNEMAGSVRAELAKADNPGYVIGNPNGSATFIEFLDYRCGYCKRAHSEVEKLVDQNSEARVVLVMRPILGPDSETLARFAMAADLQGKFHEAHSYLYENTVQANDESLRSAAGALGLDWNRVQSDMTGEKVTQRLAENNRISDELNVTGTPFFITPKRVIPGATDAENLKSDIG
jgi:protein-disulfide isomerase